MDSLVSILQQALEVTSGCTEPAAIAYCSSFAGQLLHEEPTQFILKIDQRTYKNAFAAGIPHGAERKGTEWALLLGFAVANPDKRLAIFSLLNKEYLAKADQLHTKNLITIELLNTEGLLIDLIVKGTSNTVHTIIKGGHTNVSHLEKNGAILNNSQGADSDDMGRTSFQSSVFSTESWPELINRIYNDSELQNTVRQGIAYNMAAAFHGQKYLKSGDQDIDDLVMGAIYSRMNGDPIPVMSCAGSGNKGLTSIIPVVAIARQQTLGEETEIKAALVSILLTTIITSHFGEVSSVCGAQYAAGAGIIGGLLYLKDELNLFDGAYNNFVSSISGGFCDGAKGSCSMRGNMAVSAAFTAIKHAENGFIVSSRDGFLGDSFQSTLENLAKYNPLIAKFELETIKILKDK